MLYHIATKNDFKKMEVASKYIIKSVYQDKNSEKSQLGNNVQLYTLAWDKQVYSNGKNWQLYGSITIPTWYIITIGPNNMGQ